MVPKKVLCHGLSEVFLRVSARVGLHSHDPQKRWRAVDHTLVTAVQKEWAGDIKNFQRQLIPRTSPVDDHASNGAVEAMERISPIWPWLVRHQSCCESECPNTFRRVDNVQDP